MVSIRPLVDGCQARSKLGKLWLRAVSTLIPPASDAQCGGLPELARALLERFADVLPLCSFGPVGQDGECGGDVFRLFGPLARQQMRGHDRTLETAHEGLREGGKTYEVVLDRWCSR